MSDVTEFVRASVAAWDTADWETLETMWDPEGTIVAPPAWPEGGERHGWAQIRDQFERLKADWNEDHLELVELAEVRPGTVFACNRWTVTGAASGVPLEVLIWMVATIREGKFVRIEYFQEEAAARAAAEG